MILNNKNGTGGLNYSNYSNLFKYGKNNIHTSAILYSNTNINDIRTILENALNERITESNLQLVKYNSSDNVNNNLADSNLTSYSDAFPLLLDEGGNKIGFNQPIKLFDGIKLISNYLNKRFEMDKNLISEVKISELLEPFKNNSTVTVLDMFNHVNTVYNRDKDSFSSVIDKINNTTDDSTQDISTDKLNLIKKSKPFGVYGDVTINELATNIKELKWDTMLLGAKTTVHVLPVAANVITYGLILKSYLKLIHNQPLPNNINDFQKNVELVKRRRNLALFMVLGIPLSVTVLNLTSVRLSDMFSIELPFGETTKSQIANSSSNTLTSHSALLLFLKQINNKIPNLVKLIFKLIFFITLVLKLLGFSSIFEVLLQTYYLKIYTLTFCSLAILYQLSNIYLLYIFINKKPKIPEFLPEFLISWLKEFEELSKADLSYFKYFKKSCYTEIVIYVVIIIIAILAL